MAMTRKPGRINTKALIILVASVILLAAGAFSAREIRRRVIARGALTAGSAAFEREQWKTACKELARYLERRPDDADVLEKYARAQLHVEPLQPENIGAAIGAYRRVLRLDPARASTYKALADLYTSLQDFDELAYIARKRREQAPDDSRAIIWAATAKIAQHEYDAAREELLALAGRCEQHTECSEAYIIACGMLSNLAAKGSVAADRDEALAWLNRAVARDPSSVRALIQRAGFYRTSAPPEGPQSERWLGLARVDLETADELQTATVQERLLLYREWLDHGRYDRAAAELQAIETRDSAMLWTAFSGRDEWRAVRFMLHAELLLRTGAESEGGTLADKSLASLRYKPHRARVLPLATRLYVAAGRLSDAQRCLDEYREITALSAARLETEQVAVELEALLAHAAHKPYRVIELLEPRLTGDSVDPGVLKMLADAYAQTNQDRRAVEVLKRCQSAYRSTDPELALRLARRRLKLGNWTDARDLLKGVESASADVALARIEIEYRASLGQPPEIARDTLQAAAAGLATLCESNPTRGDVRVLQAAVAARLEGAEAAEKVLTGAIAECADPLPLLLTLASLYAQTQRIDEALELCQDACELPDAGPAPWLTAAEILQSVGRDSEARQRLESGLQNVQGDAAKHDLATQLAVFELLHGDRQKGIERLEGLAAADPSDVHSRSLLLDQSEVRRNAKAAQKLIDELRGIEGETGLVWRVQQAAFWLSGQQWRAWQHDARKLLDDCIAADPGWAAPALLLGRLLELSGQASEAERVYERTLAANPAAGEVADRLLGLLSTRARFSDARRVLDRLDASTRVRPELLVEVLTHVGEADRAIERLKLRVAGDARDAGARIALARLLHQQNGDTALALKYLDEAEEARGETLAITSARVAILQSAGRVDEARSLLDAEVEHRQSFEALFMRARFLQGIGKTELAEADYARLPGFEDRPDGYLLLGVFYSETGRTAQANATWERGLEAYPDSVELKRRLMTGLFAWARPEGRQRGLQLLADLEQHDPDEPELLWVRAMLALEQDTPAAIDKAQALLEQVVERRPTVAEAHLQLVRIAMQRGSMQAARELAARGLASNPRDPRLLLARATAEAALGNASPALSLARSILEGNAQNADALDLLARLALDTDTSDLLDEAAKRLQAALDAGATDNRLRMNLAMVAAARGDNQQADLVLEDLRNSASREDIVATLLTLAQTHWQRGQFKLAGTRLDEASSLVPDDPQVLRARIGWLGEQGQLDAIAKLVGSNASGPALTPEVLFVAAALLAPSESPAHREIAYGLFDRVLEQLPPQSPLWFDVAGVLYRNDAVDRALTIYREILARDPQNPRALNDTAWVLAEARHAFDEALTLAERGLELAPNDLHLLDTRGVILSNLPARLDDARHDFERCVELSASGTPARAHALLRLARITARLGDQVATRRCLREAFEIDRRHDVFSPQEREDIAKLPLPPDAK